MYSNRFVISIIVNSQVQKEFANGEVNLPFGSEYAIRFRNKNDRRAVVKLFIDGEKMCRGGFVIPANQYRDIDCSSQTLRKFKFVDLQSTEAQEHGKDQVNAEKLMGVIEAHWHLEKQTPVVKEIHHHHPYPVPRPYPVYPRPYPWYGDDRYYACNNSAGMAEHKTKTCSTSDAAPDADMGSVECCASFPPAVKLCSVQPQSYSEIAKGGIARDAMKGACDSYGDRREGLKRMVIAKDAAVRDGATVEGDQSNMRFGDIHFEYEEASTVLKLFLRGFDGPVQELVEAPVAQEVEAPEIKPEYHPYPVATDADTRYCDNCGAKIAKKSSRYCHLCGHKLG